MTITLTTPVQPSFPDREPDQPRNRPAGTAAWEAPFPPMIFGFRSPRQARRPRLGGWRANGVQPTPGPGRVGVLVGRSNRRSSVRRPLFIPDFFFSPWLLENKVIPGRDRLTTLLRTLAQVQEEPDRVRLLTLLGRALTHQRSPCRRRYSLNT
jgi:hypothetical protein